MTATTKTQSDTATHLKENERKWTKTLMAAGWTVLPNVIIERQQALGLDPLDINIILHLASRWWKAEGKPQPSKKTIADATGKHPRTIQRRIAKLEKDGFIRREQRRIDRTGSKTNIYHLDGLIKEATPYAEEKIEEREAQAQTRKRKAAQKGRAKLRAMADL